MLPIESLHILLERFKEKDKKLSLEIQLITSWIKEHRESRPDLFSNVSSSSRKRSEYYTWRKVSCRLHQRRSELKTQQEKIRSHLIAVNRRIEEADSGNVNFTVFSDIALEPDSTPVDACA